MMISLDWKYPNKEWTTRFHSYLHRGHNGDDLMGTALESSRAELSFETLQQYICGSPSLWLLSVGLWMIRNTLQT